MKHALPADLRHAPIGGGVALGFLFKSQSHFMVLRLAAERLSEQGSRGFRVMGNAADVKLI